MADLRRTVDALVRARRGGLAAGALGGLALLGALAYRAVRAGESAAEHAGAAETPDYTAVAEDEARLMLRAMVAATLADGMLDASERARLDEAVAAAGLDRDGQAWLRRELADPADIDEIAEGVDDPDAAARLYTAARLAVQVDTLQERQFLKMLAEALDLPEPVAERIERELAA